jgi:hypothetical protein
MAGTLVIDTLKASTGILATQNGMNGICKAWVYANGTTGAISGSFNVSSVTRTSTGVYQVNFTTAMPDTNYAYTSGTGIDNSSASFFTGRYNGGTTSASTFCYGIYRNTSGFWDNDVIVAFYR